MRHGHPGTVFVFGACALSGSSFKAIAKFLREFAWPAVDPEDRLTSARHRIVSSFSLIAFAGSLIEGVTWYDDLSALSPGRAQWILINSIFYLGPPLLLWSTGRLRLAASFLLTYFILSVAFEAIWPVGETWSMSLYFFLAPPLAILLLGTRIGASVSLLTVAAVVLLADATVPGPIGAILFNVTAAIAVGMLIFISEAEKTTLHLDNLRREAQSANCAKSFFLANVSHEIRTPLNGVIGAVQLLTDHAVTQEQKELLNTADASGRTLLRIVNDILDFSRIIEHGVQLEQTTFRREDLVTNVFSALAAPAERKGISLRQQFAEDVPRYLVGDRARLSQIVMNYVGNAVKFSDSGTVEVRVTREAGDGSDGGDMIRVEVRDEGIGMTEEAAARVFETFEQAENSTARIYGGTGLGLSIARNLAKLHGGATGVRSKLGQGSTFWFTFPLVAGARPADRVEVAVSQRPARTDHARVMVVEDNKTNQFIARKFLAKLGVDPEIAADGVEAVEAAARTRFDLIFMDIQLPRKSGIEATRDIRAGGLNRDTPIVALSANVMADQKASYLAAGMNGCIEKPCTLNDISECLDRFVPAGAPPGAAGQAAEPPDMATREAEGRGNDSTSASATPASSVSVTKAGT
ncbi:ATP-binding protein [Antarcticimicrobium luteum]|uniref:ATP-binding protein n=1 Tax=Antarcticimicrobium luteum TaxID=2547397 RepID=UPI00140E4DF1|nr:ATP-binding protein [Antarcticimicrobium luteum]